jgi:hypothetical protein
MKIKQKPKITKKSPAKARPVGGARGANKTQHVHGLSRQEKKTASGGKPGSISSTNKMPQIVEYPGESKGRGFGPGVKVVGKGG